MWHTRIMGRQNQHWQKETVVHWESLFKKITQLLQHRRQWNWIFILKTLFSQNCHTWGSQVPQQSTVGLQLLNLWLLTITLICVNNGVTAIKPGDQTTGNARVIWSDESSFTLFPTSGRVYVWRTPKETYNAECLVPTVEHGGGSVMVGATILRYSVGRIIALHDRITARDYPWLFVIHQSSSFLS
jgi:hypothetical protein